MFRLLSKCRIVDRPPLFHAMGACTADKNSYSQNGGYFWRLNDTNGMKTVTSRIFLAFRSYFNTHGDEIMLKFYKMDKKVSVCIAVGTYDAKISTSGDLLLAIL